MTTRTFAPFATGIDRPVPGDYDGDGKIDLAVYRPSDGLWRIQPSAGGAAMVVSWGLLGDLPVPGDYDGDGKTDPAVHRPSNGFWFVRGFGAAYQWAAPGDAPVPNAIVASAISRIGAMTDLVRATDFDGDGQSTFRLPACRRHILDSGASSVWYSLASGSNYSSVMTAAWGLAGDLLVPGDYDGDGISEPAVWRPSEGNWYFRAIP